MTGGSFSDALNRLESEVNKEGYSPQFLGFYQRLLRIQSGTEQRVTPIPPGLQKTASDARNARGLPLIAWEELPLDWSLVKETFADITTTFAAYPGLFGEVSPSLLEIQPAQLKEIVKAWYQGSQLPATISENEASQHLLQAIILATLKPFLVSYARTYRSQVDQERWRRGYCPMCGGRPDLAYLEKEVGARWLVCSRCDTAWLFQRLQCPYCNTTDQNALAYYTDDEGRYRLYVCEQCRQYLKTIDLRQTKGEILPPLERLLTVRLDVQAQEQGYTPPDYSPVKLV